MERVSAPEELTSLYPSQTRKNNHPWSATIWHLQPVVMIVSTTLYYRLRRTSQICSKMGTSGATQTGHGLDCNLKHPLGGQYDKQVPEYAHDKHVLSCSSRCYGWFSPHNFQVSNLARVPKKNPMSSYSLYGLCFYQQTPTINPRRTPLLWINTATQQQGFQLPANQGSVISGSRD